MTFKEKLAQEHPDRIIDAHLGGCRGCPNDYGYEDTRHCGLHTGQAKRCTECWNREIPETIKEENMQEFKKSDLRTGDIVVRNCGKRYVVLLNTAHGNYAVRDEEIINLDNYSEDLIFRTPGIGRIEKVLRPEKKTVFNRMIDGDHPIIWERKRKMTVSQVEKEFRIEII